MYTIPKSPLTALLHELRRAKGTQLSVYKGMDYEYKSLIGPAMELALMPVYDIIPAGNYSIAGGVIRSVFNKECPIDVDIFVLGTDAEIEAAMYDLLSNHPDSKPKFTKGSITYSTHRKHIRLLDFPVGLPGFNYSVQFIGQWYESLSANVPPIFFERSAQILETFDMVSTCYGIDVRIGDISSFRDIVMMGATSHPQCLQSIANKEILINSFGPMHYKKIRADRLYKYIVDYGFRVLDQEQMKKLNLAMSSETESVDLEYT